MSLFLFIQYFNRAILLEKSCQKGLEKIQKGEDSHIGGLPIELRVQTFCTLCNLTRLLYEVVVSLVIACFYVIT